ncbi:hypothetical protein VCSRO28_3483 [Vibrio cholerae]|nr:hypothetical protein VCSRO28_3483 [Vibrio cholerae]
MLGSYSQQFALIEAQYVEILVQPYVDLYQLDTWNL